MTDAPKWTVFYNIVSPESSTWIGMGWEFFTNKVHAETCMARNERLGYVVTMRPFHENDRKHMGAAHR